MGEEIEPSLLPQEASQRAGEKGATLPGLSPSLGLGCWVDTRLDVSLLDPPTPLAGRGERGYVT